VRCSAGPGRPRTRTSRASCLPGCPPWRWRSRVDAVPPGRPVRSRRPCEGRAATPRDPIPGAVPTHCAHGCRPPATSEDRRYARRPGRRSDVATEPSPSPCQTRYPSASSPATASAAASAGRPCQSRRAEVDARGRGRCRSPTRVSSWPLPRAPIASVARGAEGPATSGDERRRRRGHAAVEGASPGAYHLGGGSGIDPLPSAANASRTCQHRGVGVVARRSLGTRAPPGTQAAERRIEWRAA
jgi:hypothetical protein